MQPERIPLRDRKGQAVAYALVDAAEYPILAKYRWHRNSSGYAARGVDNGGHVLMHRQVLGLVPGDGECCDHINHDKLDNRRANLRTLTHAENQQNRRSRPGSASRFRSVFWDKRKNRWRARVRQDGKDTHIGYFSEEVAAAVAAEAYRLEHMPYAEPDPALAAFRTPG